MPFVLPEEHAYLYQNYLKEYRTSSAKEDQFRILGEMHVLVQSYVYAHVHVHAMMLRQAVIWHDFLEVVVQLFFVFLAIPAAIFERYPRQVSGWLRGGLAAFPVPTEVLALIPKKDKNQYKPGVS